MPAEFKVDDSDVRRALAQLASGLDDLEPAWAAVGRSVVEGASPLVPVASGALVDSLTVESTGTGFEVAPRGPAEVYAGVQNYGWPARNIDASGFLEAGAEAGEQTAVHELEQAIDGLIRRVD